MDLKPAGQIEEKGWMKSAAVTALFDALGYCKAGRIVLLFVGGCVRNEVAGRDISDIDLATILPPDRVMEKLEKAGIKALPTGLDHGTVTAVIGKAHFEITTLRRDVSTDGRRAVVAFTDDWREDAQRRDFTVNTLLMDQGGNIYDPTGQGLDDLKAGRVRFVGDARQRVQEDYLRILRFFRFYAVYGKGAPDAEALAACREFAGCIGRLSKERITQEFRRILMTGDPTPVLELMFKNGVLSDLPAPGCDLKRLRPELTYPARLLVLAAFEEKETGRLARYLILSKQEMKALRGIAAALKGFERAGEKEIRRGLYHYGREITAQAMMLYKGQDLSPDVKRQIEEDIPVFPLDGEDVKAAGIAQGPEIGRIMRDVEQWWIEKDFKPGRAACLKKIRQQI